MILMLVPMMCFAEEPSMQMQMLDNEIERLTKQRDEKFAALQKCEETTKGFKIAGIATLAATGLGVYGNIKLSQKLQGKGSKGSSRSSTDTKEDDCAKDPICNWERQCKMQGYKVTNCDHDTDCCAADGCPCEK